MTILQEAGTLTRAKPGTFLLQLISPGTGSSGTYTESALKQAADDGVFKAGTLSFIDHLTEDQEWSRPEGSLKDLAGVLAEDARWDDRLNALVAEATIFEHWRPILEDMKDSIGVSIRAVGEAEDTADGRVITKITEARSVDFVTRAGRGGRVLEILESARPTTIDGITRLFEATQPPAGNQGKEPIVGMIQVEESAHTALQEKASRADTLETQLTEANQKIAEYEAKEAAAARRQHVTSLVEAQFADVEDPADIASLLVEAHLGESFTDEQIIEAAKNRASKLGTNPVHGVGQSAPLPVKESDDDPLSWDDIAAVKGL